MVLQSAQFKPAGAGKTQDTLLGHIIVEAVEPCVDRGRYPAKRIVGEPCVVEADIFRDGHQIIRAAVKYRRKSDESFAEAPMRPIDNDRWGGEFIPSENTRYVFTIEAWTDQFASWLADFRKKVIAGRDVHSDLLEGIAFIEKMSRRASASDREVLARGLEQLRSSQNGFATALKIIEEPALVEVAERVGERAGLVRFDPLLEVTVDRPKARFSTWYEMFPRSQGTDALKSATFRDAERRLPAIADMGFDVVYLPPIHPIGITNRKGPNNSLNGGANSPGSPWAIGNQAGGHDSIDPGLGTIADFEHFIATGNKLGIETAIDFAVQCSPDHPWVREHPEWFSHRPDGSIKYAENPPKEYQDIYPIDFDTKDQAGLMRELLRVVNFWIDHGVKIFRVDNPHTKPVAFWEWLIGSVQASHPEVLFLAEAFTRPKLMKVLAKAGFTQSYSYFTWRNTKLELTEYLTELTQTAMREYFRPNLFTNTPDILSPILQQGGVAAFRMRLVLAATLSSSYGIYSGYELCENLAVPGTEEYLNSEKYEIKIRDWSRPGNIMEFIAKVNAIRRENLALHDFLNLEFLETDSDQILCYAKSSPKKDNVILVAVNLDPFSAHYCTLEVPPAAIDAGPGQPYIVTDLLSGAIYTWSDRNYVRLDPAVAPAHILRVEKRL
ncbi:MAG TPA: alpha-1,4-glucan--maltose-1-phosphate maltosyltransferase [Candidatus Binataceae bacterium]|nr:alpha-1,4-glucan--maltose-1-phosphate maltosyltransferase [Candidatus Binataceae bacterium]